MVHMIKYMQTPGIRLSVKLSNFRRKDFVADAPPWGGFQWCFAADIRGQYLSHRYHLTSCWHLFSASPAWITDQLQFIPGSTSSIWYPSDCGVSNQIMYNQKYLQITLLQNDKCPMGMSQQPKMGESDTISFVSVLLALLYNSII